MEALNLLLCRNSASKLTDPAPDPASLAQMFAAALRAPDHAWLTPWRFVTVAGEARHQLGEVFLRAAQSRQGELSLGAQQKLREQPLRAPLLVVAIARIRPHPKVPEWEQLLSVGCAAHGLLLAAEALGFAGIWRTGDNAGDPQVAKALGLAADERIIGFLYFGTRVDQAKSLPARAVENYVQAWTGEAP